MTIYEKLANIQKELIAPKGQRNDFGKYNYRSCEDILKALKPLCDKFRCVTFITNELKNIGDRNYVEASITLVDLESGESITSKAQAREEETKKGMDGSQITGASSSYARKYALAGLFCIDNEKDSDATNKGVDDNSDIVKYTEQKALFYKQLQKYTKEQIEQILKHYKVKELQDLTPEHIADYLQKLEEKKNNE